MFSFQAYSCGIRLFISVFILLLAGVSAGLALSPGVQVPQWIQVKPLVRGIPMAGTDCQVGFEIMSTLTDIQGARLILSDGLKKPLEEQNNVVLERMKGYQILGKISLPSDTGQAAFSLVIEVSPPVAAITRELTRTFPDEEIRSFLAGRPFAAVETLNYSSALAISRQETLLGVDGTSFDLVLPIGRRGLILLARDFTGGLSSQAEQEKTVKNHQALMKTLASNPGLASRFPAPDHDTYLKALLSMATSLLKNEKYVQALESFDLCLREISNFAPGNEVLALSAQNSRVLAMILQDGGYNPGRGVMQGLDELVSRAESLASSEKQPANVRTMGAYFRYNRAVYRQLMGDSEGMRRDLSEALRLRPWLHCASRMLVTPFPLGKDEGPMPEASRGAHGGQTMKGALSNEKGSEKGISGDSSGLSQGAAEKDSIKAPGVSQARRGVDEQEQGIGAGLKIALAALAALLLAFGIFIWNENRGGGA